MHGKTKQRASILLMGKQVRVIDDCGNNAGSVKLSVSDEGFLLSVWPGSEDWDGDCDEEVVNIEFTWEVAPAIASLIQEALDK